jgi:type IV secretory pathway VirB4 component
MPISLLPELVEAAPWWRPYVAGAAGLAGAGAIASLMVPALSRFILPKPIETTLIGALPFESTLEDRRTLRCRDGSLTACLRIAGVDSAALAAGDREHLKSRRRSFVEALSDHGVTAKSYVLKRRVARPASPKLDHPVASALLGKYIDQFKASYDTTYTLTLTVASETDRARARLDAAVSDAERALAPFGVSILSHGPPGAASPLLNFWARLLDPARENSIGNHVSEIAEALVSASIEIDQSNGLISFDSAGARKYAYVVGVRLFGETSTEFLGSRLISIDGEFLCLQQLSPFNQIEAEVAISRRQRMMLSARFSSGVASQFEATREMITQGAMDRQTLCDFELSFIAYGDNPQAARRCAENIMDVLREFRCKPVIEVAIAQPQFFAQFPSPQFSDLTRAATLLSKNISDFLVFEREDIGFSQSDWGHEPILPFRTLGGAIHNFQFHRSPAKEESGHTFIAGANGSGKTVLMELLTLGALRHRHVRAFWFDRAFGTYVMTTAAGGRYVSTQSRLGGEAAGRLNPLQLRIDTDADGHAVGPNAAHIRNWLRLLCERDDPDTDEMIGRTLALLKDMPPEHRELPGILDCFDRDTPARRSLERWTDPQQYGTIFGGAGRLVGFDARLTSFDMTSVLEDDVLGPPTIEHILYRIEAAVADAAEGSLIVIDEAAYLCRNPIFRKRIVDYLQQIRKKRGVVVLMFQRSTSLDEIDPNFANLIRSETTNQIFFPVAGTKPADFSAWDMTDRELAFVTGKLDQARHMKRPFLLRRPKADTPYSGILESDISGIGEWLSLMRSGSETVADVMRLQKEFPDGWVEALLQRKRTAKPALSVPGL